MLTEHQEKLITNNVLLQQYPKTSTDTF